MIEIILSTSLKDPDPAVYSFGADPNSEPDEDPDEDPVEAPEDFIFKNSLNFSNLDFSAGSCVVDPVDAVESSESCC
jgi:hypothetical protein